MTELINKLISGEGTIYMLPLLLVLLAVRWLDNDRKDLIDQLNQAEKRERALLREIAQLRLESEPPTKPDTPSSKRIKL